MNIKKSTLSGVLGALVLQLAVFSAPAGDLPEWTAEEVAAPVQTCRCWISALAPNPRGGFNFIAMFWNYGSGKAPEWLIADLDSGKVNVATNITGWVRRSARADNGRIFFAGQGGARIHYYDPTAEQIKTLGLLLPGTSGYQHFFRIEKGRDGRIYATTQSVNRFAALAVIDPDTLEYRVFTDLGSPGRKSKLTYGYRLAVDPPWAYVMVGQDEWALAGVNVETGEKKLIHDGKGIEIMAFNARKEGLLVRFVPVLPGAAGAAAKKKSIPEDEPAENTENHKGQEAAAAEAKDDVPDPQRTYEFFWCVEGQLFPAQAGDKKGYLPFPARTQKAYKQVEFVKTKKWPLPNLPELDLSGLNAPCADGVFKIRFRPGSGEATNSSPNAQRQPEVPAPPAGGGQEAAAREKRGAAWKELSLKVADVMPIEIQSTTALADGSILGSTEQYNGFFRYYPKANKAEYFGKHGPSRTKTTVRDGLVYFSGYPNGHLWVYDPAKPWTSSRPFEMTRDSGLNPLCLGNFGQTTDAHYTYFLQPGPGGRIYFAGRRERRAHGTGVGYYEVATGKFHGNKEALNFLAPRGLLVFPGLQRVIVSGELSADPTRPQDTPAAASLIVYDLDLKEVERVVLKPDLSSTGAIYPGLREGQILGRLKPGDAGKGSAPKKPAASPDEGCILYLYDLLKKEITQWRPLDQSLVFLTEHPVDGFYWGQMGETIVKLNPASLEITPQAAMKDRMRIFPVQAEWYGEKAGRLYKIKASPK